MHTPTSKPAAPPAAQHAATRSAMYALFAFLFSYPDADWVAAIRAGEVAARVQALHHALGNDTVHTAIDEAALSNAGQADEDLAIEYTRLFDTGPIALYGGLQHGTRMQVMEEVLRFYEHFGLGPNRQLNDLPDHLVAELEFMHYLCHQESLCLAADQDAGHWQRGQRDFLQRQLGRWAPQLHPQAAEQNAHPFFAETTRLLAGFLAHEARQLQVVLATANRVNAAHVVNAPNDLRTPTAQDAATAAPFSYPVHNIQAI